MTPDDMILEIIPGAELVLTYSIHEYSTLIRCFDIRTSPRELTQISCPQTQSMSHTFIPSAEDGGKYIFSYVADALVPSFSTPTSGEAAKVPPAKNSILAIIQLDYSDREAVVFELVALPKISTSAGVNIAADLQICSSRTSVTIFGRQLDDKVVFCKVDLEAILHNGHPCPDVVELKVWKLDTLRVCPSLTVSRSSR
jgi:hypothetical protein